MPWGSVLLALVACDGGLPAEPQASAVPPETACDGVDSNGDGRIDEGVFAPRYVMERDEAGAPVLRLYGAQAVAAPGVRWVQERSWTVDEATDPRELQQMEFDAQGRETGTLYVYVDRDGALRESLTQTVCEGEPQGEPNERRVWDEQGRLVDNGDYLWTWQAEGVSSRLRPGAEQDVFSYTEGRLSGAQYPGSEQDWTVQYDDLGRPQSLIEASHAVSTYELEYAADGDEGMLSRTRSYRDWQLWSWQEFTLDETGNLSAVTLYDRQGEAVSGKDWQFGCLPL